MICSIRKIILRLLRPNLKLCCSEKIWIEGLQELKKRGQGRRESGAFLVGEIIGNIRQVMHFVFYDDLDPSCMDTGIIVFDAKGYKKLWKICRETGLSVVADIHTHPGSPFQSYLDRTNPMIVEEGHLAFIVPDYALNIPKIKSIGIYEYRKSFNWNNLSGNKAKQYFHIS